jgi:hypothetical protein
MSQNSEPRLRLALLLRSSSREATRFGSAGSRENGSIFSRDRQRKLWNW